MPGKKSGGSSKKSGGMKKGSSTQRKHHAPRRPRRPRGIFTILIKKKKERKCVCVCKCFGVLLKNMCFWTSNIFILIMIYIIYAIYVS